MCICCSCGLFISRFHPFSDVNTDIELLDNFTEIKLECQILTANNEKIKNIIFVKFDVSMYPQYR